MISSQYGQQRFYNGKFAKNYYHRGIDYAATTGSPVSSPAAGKVVLVGLEDKGFDLHGNCVGLDHGQGVASMFMHLDKVHVKVGTKGKPARKQTGRRVERKRKDLVDSSCCEFLYLHLFFFLYCTELDALSLSLSLSLSVSK